MGNFKIQRYDPDKVFFTSDLHFGHTNIIKYCGRPFKTVDEMNATIVENWNKTVPEDGIVFDLGDFAIGGSSVWETFATQLNGEHHLILGNHDIKNFRTGYEKFFASVSMQQIIEVDGISIWLNHYPYLCFGGSYLKDHSVWNLFGHVHSRPEKYDFNKIDDPEVKEILGKDDDRLRHFFPTQYDVGIDLNGFKPVSFREVQANISKRFDGGIVS